MHQKIAKTLLGRKDESERRRLTLKYMAMIVLLILAHCCFCMLESPFNLIPRKITMIFVGYLILSVIQLLRFRHCAQFINWEKVAEAAHPVFPDSAFSGKSR